MEMNCNTQQMEMNCKTQHMQMNCNTQQMEMNCNTQQMKMNCNTPQMEFGLVCVPEDLDLECQHTTDYGCLDFRMCVLEDLLTCTTHMK